MLSQLPTTLRLPSDPRVKRFSSPRYIALGVAVGAILVLIGWTQQWAHFELDATRVRATTIDISGQTATVLPAGLALIGMASALLLLTAGRILGVVLGTVVALAGVATGWLVFAFMMDPIPFTFKQLSQLSGIATDAVLRGYVISSSIGFGVVITVIGALVLLVVGVAGAAGAMRWQSRSSKYERQRRKKASRESASENSTLEAWDEMTAGSDPTA